MKHVALIPNPIKDKNLSVTAKISAKLREYGITVYVEDKFLYSCPGAVGYEILPENIELLIVVGGDGSVIDASVLAIESDIALLGVNLGKVGYLSEVEPDNLDILQKLSANDYVIDKKMLLSVTIRFLTPLGSFGFSATVSLFQGKSLFQNKTTTARIAPSWITTKNISLNASVAFNVSAGIASTSSICPVLDTGNHSVMPSTIPSKMTLSISINSIKGLLVCVLCVFDRYIIP